MDQARLIFDRIITAGYEGVLQMVDKEDENNFIDFKRKNNPALAGTEKSDRGTYAKALSGFANAGGGVIVWGVDCRESDGKDIVQDLVPITNLQKFKGDLDQYLPSVIQPLIIGVENQIILKDGEQDTGFVVTYVPESDVTPHRSLVDHLYWTRSGKSFMRVDHPMLADMFGRRQRPKLELFCGIGQGGNIGQGEVQAIIYVGIRNVGRYVARYPSLIIREHDQHLIGWPHAGDLHPKKAYWGIDQIKLIGVSNLNAGFLWTGGSDDIIHPNTVLDVAMIKRYVTKLQMEIEKGLTFRYEIYAEGCQPNLGVYNISSEDLIKRLHL